MRTLIKASFHVSVLAMTTLSTAFGQTDAKTGYPRLGFVFDSSAQTLRPVSGIPGAAIVGPALNVGAPMLDAVVSPLNNYALFKSSPDLLPMLVRLGSGTPDIRSIAGAAAAKTLVLSPSGTAALLSSPDASSAQILTGLPDQPVIALTIDFSALPGRLEAMAISDGGIPLVSMADDQTGSSIYLLAPGAAAKLLTSAAQVSAMGFFPGRSDALIADRQNNQVLRITNAAGAASISSFANETSGVSDPVGIAVSADGRKVYVANAASKSVLVLDAEGASAIASYTCSCTPTGLYRMLGKSVFRLTDDVSQPLWILDGDAASAGIVFIPAVSDMTAGVAQ